MWGKIFLWSHDTKLEVLSKIQSHISAVGCVSPTGIGYLVKLKILQNRQLLSSKLSKKDHLSAAQ